MAAPRGQHTDLASRGQTHRLDEEPRLADAGGALNEDEAGSPVGELAHHSAQLRDLPGSINQVGRWDRCLGDLPGGQVHRDARGRCVEGWRLGQDLSLEGPQRGPGVHAKLLGERLACPPQRRQGTRLPLGSVQSKRQEPPTLLPERVLGDQCLELTDDHAGVSELESRLEPSLSGHGVQLGEPQGLGLDPRLANVFSVRRAPPEAQGIVQRAKRVGRRETRRGVHGSLEAPGIHGVGREPQDVPGGLAGDDTVSLAGHGLGLEPSSQVTDVCLKGAGGVGGWAVAPDAAGETFGRDDLVAHDDQGREDRALTSPAKVQNRTAEGRRELAEHPQPHRRLVVHHAPNFAASERRRWPERAWSSGGSSHPQDRPHGSARRSASATRPVPTTPRWAPGGAGSRRRSRAITLSRRARTASGCRRGARS